MKPLRMCPSRCRGFVLAELAAIIVVIGVVMALLFTLGSRSRSLSSLGETNTNLRQLSAGIAQFASDHQNQCVSYTWRRGTSDTPYEDLRNASTDVQAAANQAVAIIRSRGDLPQLQRITSWVPHLAYNHLPLFDYLGIALPSRTALSPEDKPRLAWALDRSQWDTGVNAFYRLPFTSSYEFTIEFMSSPGDVNQDGLTYNIYKVANVEFGFRRLDEITYPSFKAVLYDRHQRHFGSRRPFFMHEEARVPVAAADQSVATHRSTIGNQGWKPHDPDNPNPSIIDYYPSTASAFAWDPPALDPSGTDIVPGRYRYTRGGLAGRDFDASEVP